MILHGYWRSGTSYRTRIALNLKGLAYEQAPVDLRTGDQRSDVYLALNPQGLVPALELDDGTVDALPLECKQVGIILTAHRSRAPDSR